MSNLNYFQRIIDISSLVTDDNKAGLIAALNKNSVPEPNTGCILWLGDSVHGGYGRTTIGSKKVLAHRLSYTLHVGNIQKGFTIDHTCKQPCCINPLHLEAVTHLENNMRGDSFSKVNALKTHCPQGHAYDEKNTFINNKGRRECRTCINAKSLKRYYANKNK